VILGSVLALAGNQIVHSFPSDIELILSFPKEIADRLKRVELSVEEEGKENPISTVVFNFEPFRESANLFKHQLRLLHGNYQLHFKVDCLGVEAPMSIRRPLMVSSDAVMTVHLP